VAAFYRNDFENARRNYEKLTELAPEMAEHWLNLGTTLQKQSRLEESAHAYARACRVRPDSINAHVYLGAALWKAGDLTAACSAYEAAALKWPDREELTLSHSQVLEALDQSANAETVCAKFCERTPNRAAVWFRLGYLQWKRGAAEPAISSFESALQLHPGWTEAEINLALACQATGQLDRAQTLLEGVRHREPHHAGALRALATLTLKQSKQQQALDLHKQLIEMGEANEDVFFNCGVLAQGLNHPEDAIKYYREALALRKELRRSIAQPRPRPLNLGPNGRSEELLGPGIRTEAGVRPDLLPSRFRASRQARLVQSQPSMWRTHACRVETFSTPLPRDRHQVRGQQIQIFWIKPVSRHQGIRGELLGIREMGDHPRPLPPLFQSIQNRTTLAALVV